jgi:hypothetical protein
MTIARILYAIAAVLFFLAGIRVTFVPNPEIWGLFCIALGLVMTGYDLGFRRHG